MHRRLLLGCVLSVALAPVAFAPYVSAEPLRAGAATSNITPEIGRSIIGGFVPFPSTHVHDDLHARCLVLDDGKTRLAIVVCDLLGFHRRISEEARQLVASRAKIPRENVLICATHTHSASSALGDRSKPQKELNDYQQFVARRIADGVTRAANELRPAELAFGSAEAPEHVFNRRWSMQLGTIPPNPFGGDDLVKMNPPRGKNLVEPAGPTNPTVSFFAVREPGGAFISVFASYSLHYVGGVPRGHISADYYAVFCKRLAELLKADRQQPAFVPMMANGTSGDVNNINFTAFRPRKLAYEKMRDVGEDVAEKVYEAMKVLAYRRNIKLGANYREMMIPRRTVDADMRKWAAQTLEKGPIKERDLSFIYAQRVTALDGFPKQTKVPLQVLHVGAARIGTMPCEVFCETGLEFSQRTNSQPAFLVSLSHGYEGYLPPPRHHKLGGYETWLGTNRLEKQASVKMLDALLQMAND